MNSTLCYRTKEEWKPTKPKKGVQVSFLSFSKEERVSANCSFFSLQALVPSQNQAPRCPDASGLQWEYSGTLAWKHEPGMAIKCGTEEHLRGP